jgi:hypothetical protein
MGRWALCCDARPAPLFAKSVLLESNRWFLVLSGRFHLMSRCCSALQHKGRHAPATALFTHPYERARERERETPYARRGVAIAAEAAAEPPRHPHARTTSTPTPSRRPTTSWWGCTTVASSWPIARKPPGVNPCSCQVRTRFQPLLSSQMQLVSLHPGQVQPA